MAHARIIDYYAILNLPSAADLTGIENAYARLSAELAESAGDDDEGFGGEALARLNEAYGVLSRPSLRRDYDRVYFSRELEHERTRRQAEAHRRGLLRHLLVGVLVTVVLAQVAALAYVEREQVSSAAETVFGPLLPGEAN